MKYQPAIEELAVCCKTADLCAHYWGDKGNAELLAGKYSDGLKDLTHALTLEPKSLEADAWRQLRAMCDCGTDNFGAAIQEYNKLIAESKKPNFALFVDRGKVYACMKLNDKAIADFSKAVACCPAKPLPGVLALRRNTYFSSDKLDLARSDSDKLIAFDSENENYYFFRSYIGIRQRNYKSAIDDLTKAIAIDPDNVSLYYECRADAHFRKGEYQAALNDYSAALKSDQSRSSLYAGQALCYAKLGKQSLAIEQLKTANKFESKSTTNRKGVSSDTHNTDASSTTGLTKLINNRRQEVIRMAAQAIKV
jgi:tetratricopeptide (TPR) repeat protein